MPVDKFAFLACLATSCLISAQAMDMCEHKDAAACQQQTSEGDNTEFLQVPAQGVQNLKAGTISATTCTQNMEHPIETPKPLSAKLEDAIRTYQSEYEARKLHQDQRFLGVRLGQNPNDQQVIQEILYDVMPDLIVETGTNSGGSAVWLVSMMSFINPDCKVITVDPKDPDAWAKQWQGESAKKLPQWKQVEFYQGFSTDSAFTGRVGELAGKAKRVLVILDSDHSTKNVKAEIEALHSFVTPGSYLIVEDVYSTGSPKPAVDGFLSEHPEFAVDKSREYLMFSQHRGGYLRRDCSGSTRHTSSMIKA